jgi:hypothetical protein
MSIVTVSYTLTPDDVASARFLGSGINPKREIAFYISILLILLAVSLSPWSFRQIGLIAGIVGVLLGMRVWVISRIQAGAVNDFRGQATLRAHTDASWDDQGVTISPSGFDAGHVPWTEIKGLRENSRLFVFIRRNGITYCIPKRAFQDAAKIAELRNFAQLQGNSK